MRWIAVLFALAIPAAADEAALEAAWRGWVEESEIARSSMAVTKDGDVVGTFGIGGDAQDPAPLASLSKAITAACILALIDEGQLRNDSPLSEVFSAQDGLVGNGGAITIDALLTHTSGLNFDRTQTVLNPTLWGGGDLHDTVTKLALGRSLGPGDFFYNNENYAVLGRVIMEITGESVEDACRPRALSGLDSAALNGRSGGASAWMGWEMSVSDYARFANRIEVAQNWPFIHIGDGDFYGPGILFNTSPRGVTIWHSGAFCVLGLRGYGSYFFVLDTGWGAVVTYDRCIDQDELNSLIASLSAATRGQ